MSVGPQLQTVATRSVVEDAMGAVVQVITRRSSVVDRPRVSGALEGGSFGSFRGDAHLTGARAASSPAVP